MSNFSGSKRGIGAIHTDESATPSGRFLDGCAHAQVSTLVLELPDTSEARLAPLLPAALQFLAAARAEKGRVRGPGPPCAPGRRAVGEGARVRLSRP